MNQPEVADQTIEITYRYDAPRQAVFDAFTIPEHITKWWGPQGFEAPLEKIEVDLRVGGKHNIVMVVSSKAIADGMGVPMGAEFPDISTISAVEKPSLLVLDSPPQPEIGLTEPMTTRIEFIEHEGGTLVKLTGGPYTPSMGSNAEMGWRQSLEKLEAKLVN